MTLENGRGVPREICSNKSSVNMQILTVFANEDAVVDSPRAHHGSRYLRYDLLP